MISPFASLFSLTLCLPTNIFSVSLCLSVSLSVSFSLCVSLCSPPFWSSKSQCKIRNHPYSPTLHMSFEGENKIKTGTSQRFFFLLSLLMMW